MFEFMHGGRSAVVNNEGKPMSAFAQSVDKNRGKPAPMASGKLGAGGPGGKPGAGGQPGKQDVAGKSMQNMKQTIADAEGGDKSAKDAVAKANQVMLKHQAATIAKQAKQMGGKGGK